MKRMIIWWAAIAALLLLGMAAGELFNIAYTATMGGM